MSTPSKAQLYIGLTRPKTLLSGLSSVLVAIAYAYSQGDINWFLAVLIALVAVSAQIGSNIANDLIDYRRGADTDTRKGPLRPLSKGLVSEREVRIALSITLGVLAFSGITLIALSSWWLIIVALAVVLGLFAYSGGPFPLSYRGLGDVAVLVFFGWIPVVTSYYILRGDIWDVRLWHIATAIGLASVNILVVNNYRDYEEDRSAGKQTLIVRLGKDFAPKLYLSCGLLAFLMLYPLYSAVGIFALMPYLHFFLKTYRSLQTKEGIELNQTLAHTAQNVLILALTIAFLCLIGMP